MGGRIDLVAQQVRELEEWRAAFSASIPAEPAAPAETVDEEIPNCWDSVQAVFPFVYSNRDKCHKVVMGYPHHPRTWRTKCGWPFGFSDVAEPAQKVAGLPQVHFRAVL